MGLPHEDGFQFPFSSLKYGAKNSKLMGFHPGLDDLCRSLPTQTIQ